MQFNELLELLGEKGCFDLASAAQLSGLPVKKWVVQAHRWRKAGKLISLRRGMYAFSEKYRRVKINPSQLANQIYTPSYLSTHWALGFYGLIPEKVVTYTSITSRVPKTFSNEFGTFSYRHIKPGAFFGYHRMSMDGTTVLLAEPEKALLDLWHLERGVWDPVRMAEMRFQNMELIQPKKLVQYTARFASPRLRKAVRVWMDLKQEQPQGTVEL